MVQMKGHKRTYFTTSASNAAQFPVHTIDIVPKEAISSGSSDIGQTEKARGAGRCGREQNGRREEGMEEMEERMDTRGTHPGELGKGTRAYDDSASAAPSRPSRPCKKVLGNSVLVRFFHASYVVCFVGRWQP